MDGEMGLLEFIMFVHADNDGLSDSDSEGGSTDSEGEGQVGTGFTTLTSYVLVRVL